MKTRNPFRGVSGMLALLVVLGGMLASSALAQGYKRIDLASDVPGAARFTDGNLHNAWGLVASPSGRLMVADNGTGVASTYTGSGRPLSLVITIPSPSGDVTSTPTDLVENWSWGFAITNDAGKVRPSWFLFVTEDGTIAGWNPELNRTNAFIAVDNSGSDAVYKGVAMG